MDALTEDALDRLDEAVEERLGKGARYKLTGNYAADARELRRGRRMYWDLYGPQGERADPHAGERQHGREERERRRAQRQRKAEEETKRVNLERVSQRLLLERQDLEAKIAETRREFGKLARRKIVLEDEWKKLHLDRANLEEDKKRFQASRRSPWFQSNLLPTSDLRRVRINVGGQLFETCEKVLKRDPGSLLAALVQADSPLKPDDNGCYVIDRDWFLFRHVLAFLRDGALPQFGADHGGDHLVANLYKEAEFYNLESLRCAIREYLDPYQIVEKSAAVPLSRLHKLEAKVLQSIRGSLDHLKGDMRAGERAADDALDYLPPERAKPNKDSSAAKDGSLNVDWWTKGRYNGRDYSMQPPAFGADGKPWKRKGNALEHAKAKADSTTPFTTRATWFRELENSLVE